MAKTFGDGRKRAASPPRRHRARTAIARAETGDAALGVRPGLSFPVVAIGASAGGLAAFTALLKALPPQTGMAFVLIQHLEPKHESALTALLSKATAMPVVEVSDGIAVEPDHVYVIPPNKNMTIRKGTLRLAPRSELSGLQRPIDDFSIASGGGAGQRGHWRGPLRHGIGRHLRAEGDQGSRRRDLRARSENGPMARHADERDHRRFRRFRSIAQAHRRRTGAHRAPSLPGGRAGSAGRQRTGQDLPDPSVRRGVDFRLYKQATVRRRIARRMALQKIASLRKYAQILTAALDEEAQALADDIFIHVTSFFRDPECFQALRKRVLAKLGRKRGPGRSAPHLGGWMLHRRGSLFHRDVAARGTGRAAPIALKIQIFGTDIQERAVDACPRWNLHGGGGRRSFSGAPEALFRQDGAAGIRSRSSSAIYAFLRGTIWPRIRRFPGWISSVAGTC